MSGFSGKFTLSPAGWSGGMRGKELYLFELDPKDPLTYEDTNGNLWRPNKHQFTDMGSVPKLVQFALPKWFSKDRYLPAYSFHDDAYTNKGWWCGVAGGWEFRSFSRKQADLYLRQMVRDLGGSWANAQAIYFGVRMGGWASWGKTKPIQAITYRPISKDK